MFSNNQQPVDVELEKHNAKDLANKDSLQYPQSVNEDDGIIWDNDLNTKADDQVNFARKVLGIVAVQMAITFAMTLLSSAITPVGLFFKSPVVQIFGLIAMVGCAITLICDERQRKTVPNNYILLMICTVGEAIFVASIAANLTPGSVLTAMAALAIVTSLLFLAAVKTSTNAFLVRNLITAVIVSLVLNVLFAVCIIFYGRPENKFLFIVLTVGICAISGIFIVFDLVVILIPGAADKEDYILHALSLYLDIVRLFIQLLIILGEKK